MKAELKTVKGYQGDHMNLPVANLDAAIPFYESVLGFRVLSRSDDPQRSAVLGRDNIQMRLAENGGDPTQDGCAFQVNDGELLFSEFKSNGLNKDQPAFGIETHGGTSFKVFYVVAPDGLCYWFGERQG
jgi:lactoylglutathione lyase